MPPRRAAAATLLWATVTTSWSFAPHRGLRPPSSRRRLATQTALAAEATEANAPAEIYVCSNHWCASRGAEPALASFVGLLPEEERAEDVGRTVQPEGQLWLRAPFF